MSFLVGGSRWMTPVDGAVVWGEPSCTTREPGFIFCSCCHSLWSLVPCVRLADVVQGQFLKHRLEENEYCLKLILKSSAFLKCGSSRDMAILKQFFLGNHLHTISKTFKEPYALEKSTVSKWLMLMEILALHRFFHLSEFHLLEQ